ncbi:GntR family transcriptional regulator [Saccharospirillum impatiens]|uniref:GntR family transcriptional regulator n=1 Tax=Saccharospirillum impatiens TaxID=169438 RepID=UPI00041FF6B2|nr:GntR family transcriptional regulator [Saccharospirillum impatiens]
MTTTPQKSAADTSTGKKQTKRLPLYIQISELLHREIAAGHYKIGERLPIEADLATQLGVAIGTLRKALSKLEGDGMLERRQGSGTYVKATLNNRAVYQLFRLELLEGGGMPNADTLSVTAADNAYVAGQLGLDHSTPLWRIRRLRYLNQTPVAAEEIWLDQQHDPLLSADKLLESLYKHYRDHFDFWITHIEDRISCTGAPDWVADLLGKEANTMLGFVERLSWSSNDRVEEFSYTWFDPAVVRYISRLS